MKVRKIMKYNVLVQETMSQLKSRFTPMVSDIKKCIETLLAKEYFERLDGDSLGNASVVLE
jgi:cullin 1